MTERNNDDGSTVEDAGSATLDRGFDSRRLHDFDRRCGGDPTASVEDPAQILPSQTEDTATLYLGDETWHGGPGWYYVIDDYPDEGSCGPFAEPDGAIVHAAAAGLRVEPTVLYRCARCLVALTASIQPAEVDTALSAHREVCPGPVELPPAADA